MTDGLTVLVGLAFAAAAVAKGRDPDGFAGDLSVSGVPAGLVGPLTILGIAFEGALAASLVVGALPGITIPAALGFLCLGAALSVARLRRGTREDCGCFGDWLVLSVPQSLALNALLAALLLAALWVGTGQGPDGALALLPALAGAALAGGLGVWARQRAQAGRPLVDRAPDRAGQRWAPPLPGAEAVAVRGETLVALVSPSCAQCRLWLRVMGGLNGLPDGPECIALMVLPPDTAPPPGLPFPMHPLRPSAARRLRLAYPLPTGFLLRDGVVVAQWSRTMPEDLVAPLRAALAGPA